MQALTIAVKAPSTTAFGIFTKCAAMMTPVKADEIVLTKATDAAVRLIFKNLVLFI